MELTKEQAIKLYESKWWEGKSSREIVQFQLFTPLLCVPFELFHKAVEEALDRPVFTHEFAASEDLEEEFLGKKEKPSFQEIMNILPKDKLILVGL